MIYLLKRTDDIGWDEYDAKVIRASSKQEARLIADEHTGDEGKIWTTKLVTCDAISGAGDCLEILASFRAG